MEQITNWFNQKLLNFGTSVSVADYLDNFAVLLIIILLALAVDYICRYILLGAFKKFAKKTTNQLDDLIIEKKIINKGMHTVVYTYLAILFQINVKNFISFGKDPHAKMSFNLFD